ncbi:OmpA family protein [Fibrella arboris]|uniref:OmpA family protein n=1 Tax=Fibrella arboris TaxID=3242486 RepID=UPI003520D6DF
MPIRLLLLSSLLACSLASAATNRVGQQVCLRLLGVVQDVSTHQPLAAKLLVRSTNGATLVSNSVAGTGQFAVDIACTATVLLIERAGYRTQRLPLNPASFTAADEAYVVIPLVATDQQGVDRPYLQTEQTHYVQPKSSDITGQVQHSVFAITDALTGRPLQAQVCFVFTKTGQRTCLSTDAIGNCATDFTTKDIVALEVQATGYQPYQGNISVEQLGGVAHRHTVRLLRELVLLSVQSEPAQAGSGVKAILRAAGNKTPVVLASAASRPGLFTAYDVPPDQYELLLINQQKAVLAQQTITVSAGLNVQTVALPARRPVTETPRPTGISPVSSPASTTTAPDTVVLADNLPVLFFDEGSCALTSEAQAILGRVGSYLQQHPTVNLRLVGHTDRLGDERLNKYLGEFRAKVAASYLHWQWGIDDSRLELIGYGSRFLVGANNNEGSRRQNRRVSLTYLPARSSSGITRSETN